MESTETTVQWPYEPREPGRAGPACDVACSLESADLEARKRELRRDFFPHVIAVDELPDGFVYWFERTPERMRQIADFALYEAGCCAFMDFGIGLAAGGSRVSLRMAGPSGVKEFLRRAREGDDAAPTAAARTAPIGRCC